jgi:hypothetical protein
VCHQPRGRTELAVEPGSELVLEGLATGTLTIGNECVSLEAAGLEFLLVWPADRAEWDPVTRTIRYQTQSGATVSLSDGAAIAVTGGSPPGDEWVNAIDWIQPPARTCARDQGWWAHDIDI